MFVQDALHHHFDLGAGAFAEGPVDGHALLHLGDEFRRDQLELVDAHRLISDVVEGERVEAGVASKTDNAKRWAQPDWAGGRMCQMSGLGSPAAVKTSIPWPWVVMALLTSRQMAVAGEMRIQKGDLRTSFDFLDVVLHQNVSIRRVWANRVEWCLIDLGQTISESGMFTTSNHRGIPMPAQCSSPLGDPVPECMRRRASVARSHRLPSSRWRRPRFRSVLARGSPHRRRP